MPDIFTTRPELRGQFGAVTSTHWLASAAGMRMLDKGGNAFDAAVAAGFVLQVVEPHLNGPGGEFPAIFHHAESDRTRVVCAQGVVPKATTIQHCRAEGLELIPGNGLLSVVVPGAFDGWMLMLRDYGTLTLREVIEPAIEYAGGGHPILPRVSRTIAGLGDYFCEHWPSSFSTWLPDGKAPEPWSLFRNPDLAETWTRLLAEAEAASDDRDSQIDAARDIFYNGFIAEKILAFIAEGPVMDESGHAHSGVLTADDLTSWQASYEAPLDLEYEGWTVSKTGPWGQGPAFLQALRILEKYDIGAMDPLGPEFVHVITEALKLAQADREAYYGDPQDGGAPMGTLLSGDYAAARWAQISDRANFDFRPGTVAGFEGQLAVCAEVLSGLLGKGAVYEPTMAHLAEQEKSGKGDTCHLDVVDQWGNTISVTPSGGWLQSSPTIPGLGFALSTRAQMFWLTPGMPSSLVPGRRPRTTLTPSFARHRDGRRFSFGTPGGDQQDQWQLPFFLRILHHGMGLQEALDAPLFHNMHAPSSFAPRTSQPGRLVIDARFPEATINELRRRGHELELVPPHSLGRITAAMREPDGMIRAAATPASCQAYALIR
ncbi:gamma-glutamyltransferase family protein [Aliiroseovarius sediminis]|uniref:gamma-glutamyltransferase family protein n=1 Tax=Aliiroseovarius sediminis TaxID=2925839 RepID=UPI001F59C216|nr:gamma-glutamyltransferase family protein [Aliiroseovarius sediminis]MCI2394820.1 gamma-glutamyltransferase family protein [Aliiroseovarius sediminis]